MDGWMGGCAYGRVSQTDISSIEEGDGWIGIGDMDALCDGTNDLTIWIHLQSNAYLRDNHWNMMEVEDDDDGGDGDDDEKSSVVLNVVI